MFKVQYLSILNKDQWIDSHLGNFSTFLRAKNAAQKEYEGRYTWQVVPA